MSGTRVTPQEFRLMRELYQQLGTYAAVGRKLNRSAGTVSRYVNMRDVPTVFRIEMEKLLNKA